MKERRTQIQLRQAVLEDAEMVFQWRNDPFILVRGSSQRAVQWDEHLKWFEETIKGNHRKMFILLKDDYPIGQVRFDCFNEHVCIISVYLLHGFTGKGYGVDAIRYGCIEVFRLWDIQKVIACVRYDNVAARSAFIKAEFVEEHLKDYCPEAHFVLSLPRSNFISKTEEI
jgi:RimJ/RimL family protein N-acetyltransferase